MINVFKLKKFAVLFLLPLLSVMGFYMGLVFYGTYWMGLAFMGGGLLIGLVAGSALLKNPFTEMLEGKGILVLGISSTGIIRPMVAQVHSPYMGVSGVFKDIFDRKAVYSLAVPKMLKKAKVEPKENGGILIDIDEEEYNRGRFAMFHYPVVLYNEQIKSVLTKDWMSDKETDTFANHTILFLNKSLEDLSSVVRDFARHVVDQLKPKGEWMKSKWVMWVLLGFVIFLAILFLPKFMGNMGGSGIGANIAQNVANPGGGVVTPLN